jgi:hypothetical protein
MPRMADEEHSEVHRRITARIARVQSPERVRSCGFLPKHMQDLLRDPFAKEKPHRSNSWTSESAAMRFALVRAGIRRRAVWSNWCKPILEKSVLISSPEPPDGDRNRDPRRDRYESI